MVIYRVREGDTVASIARSHGILPTRLCEINALDADTPPAIGEALLIDTGGRSYYVKEGDSLRGIAARHRVPLPALQRQNPALGGGEAVYPGMTLTITPAECPRSTITVLGYAAAEADAGELTAILPYLTYLAIIGATADETGLHPAEDADCVSAARRVGVVPILTVAPGPGGEEALFGAIRTDEGWDALADAIVTHMRLRGYGGVLLDLPLALPKEHKVYTALLARLRRRAGYGTAVLATLSPTALPSDRAVLASLGKAATGLVLSAYDFASRYGAPAPEAPYDRFKDAPAALTECIRPQKIILGLSTRAEDFPVKGGIGRVLPSAAIPALARERGGRIAYDPVGRVPYLSYREEGEDRIVFFEDAESYYEKLMLCEEGGIGGVALFPAISTAQPLLSLISSMFSIIKPYGGHC